ncbi:hypothetical protein Stsp02_22710 [Streptomyces sp. NBRC 14336]|uniref:hypothetical protein n=1 Tax=Streptomyces sp. NBRC 14336 TaxID=3030992 RepID=UPI0024A266EA|nr:hypothetical protein [Streptomyces sp. NBRC 14336]WBO81918.1 hypothetical protein SBE_005805 [Streptomyces sp. SBE_14.2]GLW46609.1 hypothetical protein Stsp02_22710 [Streptomyces sp. NBRC 14336]
MDSATTDRAFMFVERRYGGTPCMECRSRKTVGTLYQGTVIASCEDCGRATHIGPLARLWNPGRATTAPRRRPARPQLQR